MPKKKKLSKKQIMNRQVIWTVALMSSIILIIILVPFVVKNFVNKFEYINLDFQKTRLGDLKYYSTLVPVTNRQLQIIGTYSMNFKNDPRKMDYIKVEANGGLITFNKGKPVYITLNPEMENCGADTFIALSDLSGFLRDFAGFEVNSGVTDADYAKENNLTFITCESHPENTVINFNSREETAIKQTGKNCYELTYSNCEILPVTERFLLTILKEYMSYFVRKDSSFLDMFR